MKAILLDADWDPRPGYPLTETESASRLARMASATWRNPRFTETTLDDPTPGPGEVLVRLHAAGVNHLDHDIREGIAGFPTPVPHVPGIEGAGEVAEVGAGVLDGFDFPSEVLNQS